MRWSPEFQTKFHRKVIYLYFKSLEVPKFQCNAGWAESSLYAKNKLSSIHLAILTEDQLLTDGQTHLGHSIYGTSMGNYGLLLLLVLLVPFKGTNPNHWPGVILYLYSSTTGLLKPAIQHWYKVVFGHENKICTVKLFLQKYTMNIRNSYQ